MPRLPHARIRHDKLVLLAATALGSILTATAAQAQDEPDRTGDQIQDIVVTAQFREQNLQQTPLAITAVTGDELNRRGVINMQDLTKVAPSVNLHHTGSAGGKTLAAFIRGVGASDYNFGIEPGVAFYVDDVYLGPSYGTLLDFVDLERAEVLRGPQGTLSGKNAIGGAIRLVTVKPKGEDTGYIEAETGSRGLIRMRAAYDVSLVPDRLFLRVSGYSANQNGLVKLYDFGCVNPGQLGDGTAPHALRDVTPPQKCERGSLGNTDVRAARLQLRWLPADNVEVNLSGDYIDDNARGAADVLLAVNPAGFANFRAPGAAPDSTPYFLAQYGVPYDQRFLPPNRYSSYATYEDPVYGLKFPPENTLLTKDVTLNVDWKISPTLSLSSITAYRSLDGSWAYDSDSSPLATDGVYDNQIHKQFSQEVRLSGSSFNDRLNWTVGGFYYHATERDLDTVEAVIFNLFITTDSRPRNTNYAGFVHGEFKITDALTLIGGVRQSHEKKLYRFVEGDIPGTPSNVFPGGLDVPARTKYSRTDWRVGLQWQATPDHMLYASVATGYRGGGFNPRPSNLQTVIAFGPESLVSYEAGVRSEFFDRRVRWNNTIYYSDYKNIQLSGRITAVVSGGEFPVTVVTNAAKAHIYGLESELQADLSRYITLNGAASYTKFKYDDLGPAAGLASTSGPTLDAMQRYTPKWKLNAGVQATLPVLEDVGKLTLNADYSYQTKQYADAHNSPELEIPAYGVTNARLTFARDDGWSVSLIGTNVFNKKYFYNKNFISGNFQIKGNPAPGAEWALSLRKAF
jgi:iron complex outermembrane receptor protein